MKARLAILAVEILVLAGSALAQDPVTGIPPFSSVQSGGVDNINRQNLNVNTAFPILSIPGRGGSFGFAIVNDSLIWKKVTDGSTTSWVRVTDKSGNPTYGWTKEAPVGVVSYVVKTKRCFDYEMGVWLTDAWYTSYAYTDAAGTRHNFNINHYDPGNCGTDVLTGFATDGSGYKMDATNITSTRVWNKNGDEFTTSGYLLDRNGNKVSYSVNGNVTTWTDSAGHTALVIDKSNANYIDYKFYDTGGTQQVFRLNLDSTARNIKTNFGCSGVVEFTGTQKLPISLVNQVNNQAFSFTYEDTPNQSGYSTGRLKRITLPTGGYIEYEYPAPNNGINCTDGTVKALKRRLYDASDTLLGLWDYSRAASGTDWITTVTAPQLSYDSAGNASTYKFNASGQLIEEKHYQGSTSGTLLRTINTSWATNGTPSSTTITLENGSRQTKTDTTFDSYGNLTQSIEYAWGNGTPGSAVRTTQITYETATGYTSRNILNLAKQILVRDGGTSGTIKSRTDIAYDETSYINQSCPTGVAQHDDTNFHCTFTYRGLPTTVTTYPDVTTAPNNGIARHSYYDWFGNLLKADVNCCVQKQWMFSSATNYSFPDSVTNGPTGGPQLVSSATYNSYTGLVLTTTDPNNKVTTFAYDSLKRLTSATVTDGGTVKAKQTASYDDSNRTITTTTPIEGTDPANPTKAAKQKVYFDTLGRVWKQQTLKLDDSLVSAAEVQFDALGRAYKQSNPYGSGGSASYWTESRFDALGRPTVIIPPDGSASSNNTSYSYSLETVTITDPALKQRKTESDALGRLLKVYEPDVANGNTLTQETSYAYNVLDQLLTVTQGSQTRSFTYDDMGRLLNQTTPEAGYWQYTYNVYNQVATRTDARGVVTTYTYDTLNRLSTVSYNVGSTGVPATNTITYTYGTSAASNNNGRLTSVTNTSASDSFIYDALGRVTQLDKVINSTTYTLQYAYNLASELTQVTYPSGRVVKQDYDAIGRLAKLYKDGTTTYADNFGYNAAGQVTGFNYNGASDFTAAFGFSADRLQLTSIAYTNNSQDLLKLNYFYKTDATSCPNAPAGNNGQIQCIIDASNQTLTAGAAGRSVTYTYDALYRLKTAATAGSTQFPAWGLSWTYDRYGNRTNQSQTAGAPPTNSMTISTTTNRITETWASYDANGNMTNDGLNAMTYNAENRTVTSTGAEYVYDGAGIRVRRCLPNCTSPTSRTVYVFSGTKVIAEYENGAAPSSPTREYIYLGSQLLAKFEGGTTTYVHHDHLSARVMTNPSGGIVAQSGHFPFGEEWFSRDGSGSPITPPKLKFTSYERDSESGNDYAMMRYNINRFGRFSSPDPLRGSIGNPQSLNLFAYVANDPINRIDPLGLTMTQSCDHAMCGTSDTVFINGIPYTSRDAERYLRSGFYVKCNGTACRPDEKNSSTVVSRGGDLYAQIEIQLSRTKSEFDCIDPNDVTTCTMYTVVDVLVVNVLVPLSSGQNSGPRPGGSDGAVPLSPRARAILGQVYEGTRAVTNPTNIAGWYAASAVVGLILVPSGAVALGSSLYDSALALEAAFPGTTAFVVDFLDAYFSPTIPWTWGGVTGGVVSWGQAWYEEWKTRKK